jgi:hypothetical protein
LLLEVENPLDVALLADGEITRVERGFRFGGVGGGNQANENEP